MKTGDIINSVGQFSQTDIELFGRYSERRTLDKNDVLLKQTEVCKSFYYILSGSFFQFQTKETIENIIDLHVQDEWMFNQQSLTEQSPSDTTLKAFSKSEIIELDLNSLHILVSKSPSFLQFASILNQTKRRTSFYDNALNPADKYNFIHAYKPELIKVFPIKMIASYVKIAPETLSRVRASF